MDPILCLSSVSLPPAAVPLAGLSDLQVKNPSITTLTAEWTAADGNVQGYRVTYVPSNGGLEITVGPRSSGGPSAALYPPLVHICCLSLLRTK